MIESRGYFLSHWKVEQVIKKMDKFGHCREYFNEYAEEDLITISPDRRLQVW